MHEVIADFLTAVQSIEAAQGRQLVPDGCRIVQSPTGHHQMIVDFHIESRNQQEAPHAIDRPTR